MRERRASPSWDGVERRKTPRNEFKKVSKKEVGGILLETVWRTVYDCSLMVLGFTVLIEAGLRLGY